MLQEFSESALSVLPAVVTIGLAIYTHRVLLAISIGAIIGALMLNNYQPVESVFYLKDMIVGHFFADGSVEFGNINIIAFLFLMGIMVQMMDLVGATEAFAKRMGRWINGRRSAKWMICLMALIFFIDDYFHSLAAGNISQPIADRYRISRAKLAYLLDSTAAPICVVTPVSSWGAYIIALLASIFAMQGVTEYSALGAFLAMIPMIYYTAFTLMVIGLVCLFDLNIGGMFTCESEAAKAPAEARPSNSDSGEGSVWLLVGPIGLTTLVTIAMILFTGSRELSAFSVIEALERTNMELSLLVGALSGLALLGFELLRRFTAVSTVLKEGWHGILSMWPAVSILLFAWTIGGVISDLGTGHYLASLTKAHIPQALLPVLVFLLSGFMAFSTGTSWGTFGIMLPLAADIALAGSGELLLPLLSAVLSGAVFGDHCSPISDTTILSASGAGCHHMTHVLTQFPYACIAAALSGIAYLGLGYTGSALLGFAAGAIAFVCVAAVLVLTRRKIVYLA